MKDYTDIRILLDIELFDRSYHYSDRDGAAHSYSTSSDGRIVVESDMVMYKGLIKNPASIKEGLDPTKGAPSVGNVKITIINEDNLQDGNTTVALESATATLLLVRGDMYDEVVDSMVGKIDGVSWDNSTLSFTIKSSEVTVFKQVPGIILDEDTFQSRIVLFDPVIESSNTITLRFAKAGNTQVTSKVIKKIYHPALASPTELGDGFPYVQNYWIGSRLDIVDAEGVFGDPESEVFCIGEFAIVVASDEDWVQLPTAVDRYYLYTFIDDNLRQVPLVTPTSDIPYEVRDIINNTTQNAVKMGAVSVQNGDFSASTGWVYSTPPWDINVTTPNKAHRTGGTPGSANSILKQQVSIGENVDYTVTVTVSNLSGGSVIMYLGASSAELASNGIHEITLKAVNTVSIPYVGFYATADGVSVDLDDLSIIGHNKSTMQLIRRAIPENADSVGRPFPIVYGEVSKMWAVWSISNKSTRQNSLSAGDDVYVIAGHRIYDNDPTEVLVYYGLDEKVAEWMNVKPGVIDFIPNPFPRSINEIERWHESGYDLRSGDASKDVSPLHNLIEITTNEGDIVTAIQLRGGEYDGFIPATTGDDGDSPIVNGKPQFPIRYGIGNSKVFVSFRGYADENGSYTGVQGGLIDHPIDIIKHFMLTHTNLEGDTSLVDEDSFAVAKTKLENWRFGVVINELISGDKILERLCSQCKTSWQWHNGVFSVKVLDLDSRQPTRFIDQEKHFTGKQSWSRTPLTSIYNDFTFRYAYNAITQNFDRVITKNKGNNQRCRDSFALYGAIRSFDTVEFTDIYDSYTADKMSDHYVALYAVPRITFKTDLRLDDDTQGLAPGEVVSIAFRTALGALNEVVYLTTSVTASPTGLQAEFLELVE